MNDYFNYFSLSVEASGKPELCPAGTFSSVPGLNSEAGCQPCTAGFYCGGAGLRAPTGPCSQGQYLHCVIIHWFYKTKDFGSCLFHKGMRLIHSLFCFSLLAPFTVLWLLSPWYRLLVSTWSAGGYSSAMSSRALLLTGQCISSALPIRNLPGQRETGSLCCLWGR